MTGKYNYHLQLGRASDMGRRMCEWVSPQILKHARAQPSSFKLQASSITSKRDFLLCLSQTVACDSLASAYIHELDPIMVP